MDDTTLGPPKPDLIECTGCGHLHSTTARFCDQCGAPQGRLCQECGGVNAHTAKFCSGCGAPLLPKAATVATEPAPAAPALNAYTPAYLADKILTTRSALEGERKQVTVLFVDVTDSSMLAQHYRRRESAPADGRGFAAGGGGGAPVRGNGESVPGGRPDRPFRGPIRGRGPSP